MKVLLQRSQTDDAAQMAVQMFAYQVRKFMAYAAVLNGLDTLQFGVACLRMARRGGWIANYTVDTVTQETL